jgi:hypothetical protein
VILWIRLAFATAVLLLPGIFVARALGRQGFAAAFTWSVALVAGALAFTFAVHGSLNLTLGLVLGAGVVAFPFRRTRGVPHRAIVLAGLALGGALWFIEGVIRGDALFHLARIRKLDDFGALSLRAVDEFKDGGLHPGYAFPLWHGWLALVAKVADVDPSKVVLHESSLLVPVALVLAYEAGRAVFRSAPLAFATMLASVSVMALAPGGGGSYTMLELPGTAARQLLVPAVIALFFVYVRSPGWSAAGTLAASGMCLAFVHPTYALFLGIPFVGFALARALLARTDLRQSAGALLAFGVPVILVFLWLRPLVAETVSHNPSATELRRGLKQYASDLVVHSQSSFHLDPGVVARTGAIAIAALVLVPLAGFAARRRWSALVLGGTVVVLVLELSSLVFPHFSALVSLSQSRRAAGFVPFAFALVGGAAVLARLVRVLVLPIALAAGIVLQLEYPGDFGLHFAHGGGPGAVTWVALVGGGVALAIGAFLRGRVESPGLLAALAVTLFVLPVAIYGFSHWDAGPTQDQYALTPGLVHFLRHVVPARTVVFADLETSYRIAAYAPVYVANSPPAHVANTKANRPYARRADLRTFMATGDLAIPRRYGAHWLVLRTHEKLPLGLQPRYRDASFVVFAL